MDRSCPMGPCIVPADELDASDLTIKLWLNGELKQNSRTSKMIFQIPAIIENLSAGTRTCCDVLVVLLLIALIQFLYSYPHFVCYTICTCACT